MKRAVFAVLLLTACPDEQEPSPFGRVLPACCYGQPVGLHFDPSEAAPSLPDDTGDTAWPQ